MLLFSKFFTRVRDRLGGYDVDDAERRFTDERIYEWYLEFRERLNSELGTTTAPYLARQSAAAGESLSIPGGTVRIEDVWLCDSGYNHVYRLQPTTYDEIKSTGADPTETGTPVRYYRRLAVDYTGSSVTGNVDQLVFYPVPDDTIYVEVIGSGQDSGTPIGFVSTPGDDQGSIDAESLGFCLSVPEVFQLAAVEHCAYLMAESAEEVPVEHVNRRMQIAEKAFRDGMRKWVTQGGGKLQNPYYFPSSTGRMSWP